MRLFVGVSVAPKLPKAVLDGFHEQVTVIGVVPVALLPMQPGMRFPSKVKVTLPATETTREMVVALPL